MRHGIGFDRDHLDSVTLTQDGLDTAVSEQVSWEATNATNADQNSSWKPAAAGVNKLRLELAAQKDIGSVMAAITGMDGPDDAVRMRWAKDWMEKPGAPLTVGTTAAGGITETASWTVGALVMLDPMSLTAATDDIFELRNHATTSDPTTRLVQLAVGAAGNPLVRLERMGGADEQDFTSAGQIDDCRPFLLYVSFADAGGSGGTATVYLSDPATRSISSIGTVTTAQTFGSNTLRFSKSANHHVGRIELWDRALSAAEITVLAGSQRVQTEGLVVGINVSEDSGTSLSDISGNSHTMTIGAGTFSTMTNPLGYNAEARPRHQPWRTRTVLRCSSAGSGSVVTGATLSNSPLWTFGSILRPSVRTALNRLPVLFGTNTTAANYTFYIQVTSAGKISVAVSRFTAAPITLTSTTTVDAGTEYRVTVVMGWDNSATLAINGTQEASGTAPAHTSNTSSRFYAHFLGNADFDISGPVFLVQYPMTHAEADAVLVGTAPFIPTDRGVYLHYGIDEDTGNDVLNALGAGAGTAGDMSITSSSASWVTNGVTNPSAGPKRDPAKRIGTVITEAADGVNVAADEILLELYSKSVPTVYTIAPAEVLWPSSLLTGAITGRSGESLGPTPRRSSTGSVFSPPEALGGKVEVSLAFLQLDEAAELVQFIRRAPQSWYQGSFVASTWIAIVHGPSDDRHWQWADLSGLILPEMPRETWRATAQVAHPGTAVAIDRSLTVRGLWLFTDLV